MKQIFSTLIITFFLLIVSGCTKWLDLRPESEIVLEDFWQNESQVNQVLAACYRSLTEPDVIRRMMVWGELRSDNVTYGRNISEELNKILNADITAANSYCRWGTFYTIINYCNNFLYYAPGVVKLDPNFTESKLHSLEAEVLTIRALAYFYLVRAFKEVPWVDEPSIDDTQNYNIPKSSEDFILDKLVKDLLLALQYGRDSYDIVQYDKGRITRNAIRALLADIYLWQNNYEKCIEMCDQIINNTKQPLTLVKGGDVIKKVFYYGNSSESIFELQFDDDIMFNTAVKEFYGSSSDPFGMWSFPAVLVTGDASPFKYKTIAGIESEIDSRKKDFLYPEIGGDRYFIFKYSGFERLENISTGASTYYYRNTTANWIIYRLSDIILMKAEALIQLGNNFEDALKLINLTYTRSNYDPSSNELKIETYNSKIEMEKLLLRERQRELMFEGKRWFDLMRLARRENSPAPLLDYVVKKYSGNAALQTSKMSVMDALYFPIHNDELKANSALEQNPYYKLETKE
jgi:hypothetical protein